MPLINESGIFLDDIYLVDNFQYNYPRVTSSFVFYDKNTCIIFDCGTSDDVNNVITFLEGNKIALSSVKYLTLTHSHFDHSGGLWLLLEKVKKSNPHIKILSTEKQKFGLQNFQRHMKAAHSTYGEDIGRMETPDDDDFLLIKPDEEFDFGSEEYLLKLIFSPGHTIDHCSPTLYKNKLPYFCFTGEASGTNMNLERIATLPTSMPIQFKYATFMNSLNKLIALKPQNIGLGHFGAVKGSKDSMYLLNDHKQFIEKFRNYCKTKYEESPKTKFVVDSAKEDIFKPRSDYFEKTPSIFQNNIVALVFGMLVDLGFKENKY